MDVRHELDAEDTLRAILERKHITGIAQSLLFHLIHKGFFVIAFVALIALLALFQGDAPVPSLVILVVSCIVLYLIYTRLFNATTALPKLEPSDLTVYGRDPNPDELALGFAEGTEQGEPIAQLRGIAQVDRTIHHYIIGGSGSGKSRFVQSLIVQDIKNKVGFGLIDPHGDLFEDTLGYLALTHDEEFLHNNVVVLDPTNETHTATFNPLQALEGISSAEIANELVFVFQKVWGDSWGPRMADMIRMSIVALCENGLTLNELPPLLTNAAFRKNVLENVHDDICLRYFHDRYNVQPKKTQAEWSEAVLNKMNSLLSDDRIRHIFAAEKGSFNIREIMDSGKILLVKLDRGRLKGAADTLGALLTSAFQMAAYSRSDIPLGERKQFYLYIDEFQNMASESFTEMLGEARKYRISLILAHQNLQQVSRELSAGVMANCGLQTYFRLTRGDAGLLAKEGLLALYEEHPSWEDLTQLLQKLQDRQFLMYNKRGGGSVLLTSLPTPSPHELVEMPERDFRGAVAALAIGKSYLRLRTDIETEARARYVKEEDVLEDERDPVSFWEPQKK